MAGSVLKFMLEKLESLISKEEELLGGVETGIKDFKDELESIRSFLRDVDANEERDGMRTWVRQVREIAYDIEDVLEEFLLHFGQPHEPGLVGFLRKTAHSIKHWGARHRIATELQKIKTQVHNISLRRNMYDVNSMDEGTSSNATRNRLHDRHVAALFIEEAELVGIGKPREELIGWLVNGGSQQKVVSVVGMGGLGKTTLVRKVYDDERVKGWFTCHAWIAVTQSFTIDELLRSIINQFDERNQPLLGKIDKMECIELTEILRSYLRDKRYVVVFDDVWQIHAWDCLKHALPDNNCGSRILVTTRIGDVGFSCLESSGHVYNLQPLPPTKAWFLFCKKAFRSIPGRLCPPELENLSRDIVKICDGLPLAIVAIGGLLSKKEKTVLEWRILLNNLQSELANNPNLEPIKRILSLSYNDLPHFLKSCFLYFSIFPKDYPVKRITLIRIWIAEGFIEKEKGDTMEEVAEGYLNDLIDRSMVQVAEFYDYGRVRSCRVHDLTREIIVLKSKEENFSTLIRQDTQMHEKIRRLLIHNTSADTLKKKSFSHLRALFMFGPNAMSISSMHSFFSSFRLLKVLDLEGAPIDKFPIAFGNLLHLRYLSLRNTRISKLSNSLGKLKNLETLDLKGTFVSKLPTKILKLQSLRHLLAYHYYTGRDPPFYYTFGVKVPKGIGCLRGLQKLSYLEADQDSGIVRELGNLTQLKRLGIVKLRREDGASLCASIEKMKNLHSLSLTSFGFDELLNLESLSSPPPLLQRLYLRGPLQTLPHWVASLRNLVRMRLRWSKLSEDSIKVLQALPNLAELTLIRAYDGAKLCCEPGGFQRLKILDLEQLDQLNYVIVDGAMPNLRKIYIRCCWQLQMVPLGIEQLINLKELHLFDMPEVFVQRLRRHGGTDRLKVEHIPVVRCYANEDRVYEEL